MFDLCKQLKELPNILQIAYTAFLLTKGVLMSAASIQQGQYLYNAAFAGGAALAGAFCHKMLEPQTAAPVRLFLNLLACTKALPLAKDLSTRCGHPIDNKKTIRVGLASIVLSGALFLYGSSWAKLPFYLAVACNNTKEFSLEGSFNPSLEESLLQTGTLFGAVVVLSNSTSPILSCISFVAKTILTYQITSLTKRAYQTTYFASSLEVWEIVTNIARIILASCYGAELTTLSTSAATVLGITFHNFAQTN